MRNPLNVVMSGALSRLCAWRADSHFPTRMPVDFTLFTRLMPAANSGASNPLLAASAASLRIADIRMMIEEDPSRRERLQFLPLGNPFNGNQIMHFRSF